VLQALTAGPGTVTVENQGAPRSVPATGLDVGCVFAGALPTITAACN
jgi:hypothetical protein